MRFNGGVHTYAARCCAAIVKTQKEFYQRSAATRSAAYVWTPPLKYIELLSLAQQRITAQQRTEYVWTAHYKM